MYARSIGEGSQVRAAILRRCVDRLYLRKTRSWAERLKLEEVTDFTFAAVLGGREVCHAGQERVYRDKFLEQAARRAQPLSGPRDDGARGGRGAVTRCRASIPLTVTPPILDRYFDAQTQSMGWSGEWMYAVRDLAEVFVAS